MKRLAGMDTIEMHETNRESLYENHLKAVSRSFAFCIAELRQPLREWVGLAYILCRVADTVEDALWATRESQKKSYQELKSFALESHTSERVDQWASEIPGTIPEHERTLLKDASLFLDDLKALPEHPRQALLTTLINMIDGMAHFSSLAPAQEHLRLTSSTVANQYCFFVAGIVGELLTELVKADTPAYHIDGETWLTSVHFGLFLQKINMLKDQAGDEKEGRHLIPSRIDFKASLIENAHGAIRYLQNIPIERKDYRIFCGWSLFLGLASMPFIETAWQDRSNAKISRIETGLVLAKVRLNINDNEALQKIFDDLLVAETRDVAAHAEAMPQPSSDAPPAWLAHAYHGRLVDQDFTRLRMTGL